jgi:hypothetical protein
MRPESSWPGQLREFISITLQELGGRDAALVALRDDPGTDPETIRMVEDGRIASGGVWPDLANRWQWCPAARWCLVAASIVSDAAKAAFLKICSSPTL